MQCATRGFPCLLQAEMKGKTNRGANKGGRFLALKFAGGRMSHVYPWMISSSSSRFWGSKEPKSPAVRGCCRVVYWERSNAESARSDLRMAKGAQGRAALSLFLSLSCFPHVQLLPSRVSPNTSAAFWSSCSAFASPQSVIVPRAVAESNSVGVGGVWGGSFCILGTPRKRRIPAAHHCFLQELQPSGYRGEIHLKGKNHGRNPRFSSSIPGSRNGL